MNDVLYAVWDLATELTHQIKCRTETHVLCPQSSYRKQSIPQLTRCWATQQHTFFWRLNLKPYKPYLTCSLKGGSRIFETLRPRAPTTSEQYSALAMIVQATVMSLSLTLTCGRASFSWSCCVTS